MTTDAATGEDSGRVAAGRRPTDRGRPRPEVVLPAPGRAPAYDDLLVRLAHVHDELHEGLGPTLAGIRLGLQGARNLLARDPEAALELLAHLQAEAELVAEAASRLARLVGNGRE